MCCCRRVDAVVGWLASITVSSAKVPR
jgi:hypothetical protein